MIQQPAEEEEVRKTTFEKKIKPLLMYIGTLGAILTTIAYIVVVMILIVGFKVKSIPQSLIFASVNAVIGLVIMQFLKLQGVDFAKSLDCNKKVLKDWTEFRQRTKVKKLHSIKYFWITSVIKDVVVKAFAVVVTSGGLIYIVIEGSNDYSLLLLALVNLIMFACFGFMALCKGYEQYNTEHIPYLKQIMAENKVENRPNTAQEYIDSTNTLNEQNNSNLDTN